MSLQNRPLVTTLVLGALLAGAVALGGSAFAPDAEGLPPGIVATVEGIEVTERDWDLAMFEVERSIEYMRDQVALTEHPGGPEMQTSMAKYLEAMEARSPEVAALTSIVVNRATSAVAADAGFAPSDAEVVEAVADQRRVTSEAVEQGWFDGWNRETFERTLDLVGEDAYWEEVLPALLRRGLANQRLFDQEQRTPESWRSAQTRYAREATVVLSERIARVASVEGVLDYLAALEEIELATSDTAPADVVP